MQEFNMNKVMEAYGLEAEGLAPVLFPQAKFPKQALARVLRGEGSLSVEQLEALAGHIGVLVSDLFLVDTWKGKQEEGCLSFTKGPYKALLNYKGVYLSVYKDNYLIFQQLIMPNMTIEEFINYLNNYIKDYENGNN